MVVELLCSSWCFLLETMMLLYLMYSGVLDFESNYFLEDAALDLFGFVTFIDVAPPVDFCSFCKYK